MAKVLIVDDSLTVRKVVERILESRQLEVLQAGLGTEAIERIQRDEPDLIVCDVLLPDQGRLRGLPVRQVASALRQDAGPVDLRNRESRCDRPGCPGRFGGRHAKPFSAEELTGRVSDLAAIAADDGGGPALHTLSIDLGAHRLMVHPVHADARRPRFVAVVGGSERPGLLGRWAERAARTLREAS